MPGHFYDRILKDTILKNPQNYPWNIVMAHYQFTQEELLVFRDYVDLHTMILYQTCLTKSFLKANFYKDICDDDRTSWSEVEKYVKDE